MPTTHQRRYQAGLGASPVAVAADPEPRNTPTVHGAGRDDAAGEPSCRGWGATMVGAPTTTGGFTCGIITTGAMYCWGISWLGIRGNSDGGSTQPGLVPTLVGGGHQWSDVAAGNYFVCAVAVGGGVYCWGDGDVGQLGNGLSGNPPDVTSPASVSGTGTFRAVSIGLS